MFLSTSLLKNNLNVAAYSLAVILIVSSFSSWKKTGIQKEPHQNENTNKPVVAVLGMFHFVSKNNTVSQKFNEVSSSRRQQEIKRLVAALADFKPTKIAIERPYRTQEELQLAYTAYLNGTYDLTEEETDQIAFRLGKALKHKTIYLAYAPVEYAFEETVTFAKNNGQSQLIDSIIQNAQALAGRYDSIAHTETIQKAIHYLNTDEAIAANHFGYYLLQQVGTEDNFIGATAVGDWYTSNVNIFENIRALATQPDDRILVIYGQGHCHYLNQMIKDSPELEHVAIAEYLR